MTYGNAPREETVHRWPVVERACERMAGMGKRALTPDGKLYLRWMAVGALLALIVMRFGHPHLVPERTQPTIKEMCEHDSPPTFPYHRLGWCK
jgi:hypothetical protein